MVTGILTPREAVAGFANPAPLTVGALFVVTKGLTRTGGLVFPDPPDGPIDPRAGLRQRRSCWSSLVLVGLLSAFINNTPVVVLMLSVVLGLCGRFDLSPGRFLMPISFVSILAGTTTLIGTSTNIIVSDLAVTAGLAPIGMFELARVGVPMALVGGLLLFLLAPRLLPETHTPIFAPRPRRASTATSPSWRSRRTAPTSARTSAEALRAKLPRRSRCTRCCAATSVRLIPRPTTAPSRRGDMVLVSATAAIWSTILGGKDVTLPVVAGEQPGQSLRPRHPDRRGDRPARLAPCWAAASPTPSSGRRRPHRHRHAAPAHPLLGAPDEPPAPGRGRYPAHPVRHHGSWPVCGPRAE